MILTSRALSIAINVLWKGVAGVTILFAVGFSLFRYGLPYLVNQTGLAEHWLSSQIGYELGLAEARVIWREADPEFIFEQVKLANKGNQTTLVSAETVAFVLDLDQSLSQLRLVTTDLFVQGLQLDVNQLSGQLASNTQQPLSVVAFLNDLFLNQLPQVRLLDSQVVLGGEDTPVTLDVLSMNWFNKNGKHQAVGVFRFDDNSREVATLVIDVIDENEQLDGVLFVDASGLELSKPIKTALDSALAGADIELNNAVLDARAWVDFGRHALDGIRLEIEDARVGYQYQDRYHELSLGIDLVSAVAQPLRTSEAQFEWLISAGDIRLSGNGDVQHVALAGAIDEQQRVLLNLKQPLDIRGMVSVIPSDLIPARITSGQLSKVNLLAGESKWLLESEVTDLSIEESNTTPGIEGLSLDVAGSDSGWWFSPQETAVDIKATRALQGDLDQLSLSGEVRYLPRVNQWTIDRLQFNNRLVALTASATFSEDSGQLAAQVSLEDLQASQIKRFLPASVIGPNTLAFLNRAFNQQGTVEHVKALWFGKIEEYPFSANEGIFQARMELRDTQFRFSSRWPILAIDTATLQFENQSLSVSTPAASLSGLSTSQFDANIPKLGPNATLFMDGQVEGSGQQLRDLMLQSTLNDSIGRVLDSQVSITGDLSGSLAIEMPLERVNDTSIDGQISVSRGAFHVHPIQLDISEVNTNLSFTGSSFELSDVDAMVLQQPIKIDVGGIQTDKGFEVTAQASGNWQLTEFSGQLSERLSEYLHGDTQFELEFDLLSQRSGSQYQVVIDAIANDFVSTLPAPLQVDQSTRRPLTLTVDGDDDSLRASLEFSDLVRFIGRMQLDEAQFKDVILLLGKPSTIALDTLTELTTRDLPLFTVITQVPKFDAGAWADTINELVDDIDGEATKSIFKVPDNIVIKAEHAHFSGFNVTDLSAQVNRVKDGWLIDLEAPDLSGSLNLYDALLTEGIDINLDTFRFEPTQWQPGAKTQELQLDELPPIRMICQSCLVAGRDLGRVELVTQREPDRLLIDTLSFNYQDAQARLTGEWHTSGNKTQLSGNITSSDVGSLLTKLAIDSGIQDSELASEIELAWLGAPWDFAIENLRGELDWELSDGYITELSDQGSRIFTLLSLNSLIRKLSLDFRDVFAKGFFYNGMTGSMQITDGVVDTRDTVIRGGAGLMTIVGNTDLITKELNYNVNFAPNVTGNLPFLVYFMANAPTAIAALALDQVLTSAKVISNINYSVTGTMDEPDIKETGRNSTEIELPARREPDDSFEILPVADIDKVSMELLQ